MWHRGSRVAVGILVLSLMFWGPRSLWGLLGLLPLMSGLAGSCPVPSLRGSSACATPPPKPLD